MTKITNLFKTLKKRLGLKAAKRFFVRITPPNIAKYVMFGALLVNLTTTATSPALAADKTAGSFNLLALETAQNPNLSAQQTAESQDLIATQNDIFIQAPNSGAFEIPTIKMETIQKNTAKSRAKLTVASAVKTKRVVVVTAYSSTPDQTDDSPFITANGTYVYDGIVAANFLPFGAKVRFPDYFGDKVFTVEDRMARRFSNRADIWMESREAALQFGVKRLTIEILE